MYVMSWSASEFVPVEHIHPTGASTLVLHDEEVTAEAVTLHHIGHATDEGVDEGGTDDVGHSSAFCLSGLADLVPLLYRGGVTFRGIMGTVLTSCAHSARNNLPVTPRNRSIQSNLNIGPTNIIITPLGLSYVTSLVRQ